ncbi:ATP-dependent DEAD/H RNA helicase, putative [Trypanosoma equiperdum]|uniref:ATP-dependent RNA helicase n=1 Tax=Trypanosoma equiperdum TaxID=5694 RepID=A0A1G4HZE5_TRYEQ|nr:ATP-dependent DEAD/H RNA helicase, putative [Trypanosoma equiperdum]
MGIKGRRKRQREREAKAANGKAGLDNEYVEEGEEEVDSGADDVMVMGSGPFRPPVGPHGKLLIKKTELYNMQDTEYLDRLAEEHANRRTTHLRKTRSREGQKDTASETDKLLLHHFDNEEDFQTLFNTGGAKAGTRLSNITEVLDDEARVRRVRKKVETGARFNHPLIGVNENVVQALQQEGFCRMTLIQERVIPYALQGYDLLGQAQTGSGKTLAFCVPVLHSIIGLVSKRPNVTYSLMLSPTKELCVQTHDVLRGICQHISSDIAAFSVHLITGGTKVSEERRQLNSGVSIVVGTPGRIHDHVQHCSGWDLSRLRALVLDEADRMLADGFQRSLDAIVQRLPRSRQTYLFSATNSKSIGELARLSLSRKPLFITTTGSAPIPVQLGTEAFDSAVAAGCVDAASATFPPYCSYDDPDVDDQLKRGRASDTGGNEAGGDIKPIPDTLRQFCHITPVHERLLCLYAFVKRVARTSKAMVFCSTVASTIFHFQMLGSVGFHNEVIMLHGQMKHRQRVAAFQAFNEWTTGVLLCTDVAARGLDIPDVEWILQYDPPLDPTEYVHRIGRTARAGNVGNALLFLTPEEAGFVRYLSKFGISLEKYPMPAKLPPIQMKLEHVLQLDPIVAKSSVSAFRAHVGAYQSHLLQNIFNVHRLDLEGLARSFALSAVPSVSLPSSSTEEKQQEYVKGKLKSLNKRRMEAKRYYEAQKTKKQWTEDGQFVGMAFPKS